MPLNANWYNDQKTVICLDFIQPYITIWGEYHEAIEHVYEMARSVDHQVALVVTLHDAKMPPGAPVQQIEKAIIRMPLNILFKIVMIPNDSFERNIITVLLRVRSVKERLRITDTWEETLEVLQKYGLIQSPAEASSQV